MAEQQQPGSGTGTRPKPRGWNIALAAAGAAALAIAAGCAAPPVPTVAAIPTLSALINRPTAAASAVIPTFALPTQTDIPQGTPTFTGEVPDLSSVAGAWCIPKNPAESAVVTEVVDGDTVKVQMEADGSLQTVRYLGIDAPSMDPPGQFMAEAASAYNGELVSGQSVLLVRDTSDADKDGRLLRYVVRGDTFVNLWLVMRGAARSVASPPDIACFTTFQQAEQQATTGGLGLWSKGGEFGGFPTAAIKPYCDCGGRDLDCRDFGSRKQAQSCFQYCKLLGYKDVFHLDNDGDGFVCVGMP